MRDWKADDSSLPARLATNTYDTNAILLFVTMPAPQWQYTAERHPVPVLRHDPYRDAGTRVGTARGELSA
jgi:hypothetical protein